MPRRLASLTSALRERSVIELGSPAPSVGGVDGLFYGNPSQFLAQLWAALLAIAMSFGVTFVLAKGLNATMGLRVSEPEELVGLDVSEHAERAYA